METLIHVSASISGYGLIDPLPYKPLLIVAKYGATYFYYFCFFAHVKGKIQILNSGSRTEDCGKQIKKHTLILQPPHQHTILVLRINMFISTWMK